jgi:ferric-dicitrate binding protein FerR (iron transport regulator)
MGQLDQQADDFVFPERSVSADAVQRSRATLMARLEAVDGRRTRRRLVIRMAGMAAAACLILYASFTVLEGRKASVYAGIGEKLEKTLPDGSLVIMNSDTRLRFSKDLPTLPKREVWMNGEAFFKVSRTPDAKPFIVHTEHFDVEVTGTQFNLNSGDDNSSILLTEGSVNLLMPDGRKIRMMPGTYFSTDGSSPDHTINKEEEPVRVEKPAAVLSWLDKNLVFEDMPLSDVARQIELIYRVKVKFGSENVASRRITGILPNENLNILLRAIEATTDFTIVQEKDIVNIQENP